MWPLHHVAPTPWGPYTMGPLHYEAPTPCGPYTMWPLHHAAPTLRGPVFTPERGTEPASPQRQGSTLGASVPSEHPGPSGLKRAEGNSSGRGLCMTKPSSPEINMRP
ncbi:unnamed protein product [Gadus morhua 'NCC']